MLRKYATRAILPAAGVALVAILVVQSRSLGSNNAKTTPPPPPPAHVAAQGRVSAYPGAEVTVGTDIGGIVDRVMVKEKDVVRKGDLLATIENSEVQASLSQALARVGEADADVRLFEAELSRANDLWLKQVGSRQEVDRRQRDLEAARARVATALAETARLRAVLAKSRIVAPIDGVVTRRDVDPGEAIEARKPIATIANVSRLRVEAEVDEFDAAGMRVGAPVTVTAEGYAGVQWSGFVEEIPDTVEPRRLISQDPSRATDAAVLVVKVAFNAPTPLKLGQRVDVAVR